MASLAYPIRAMLVRRLDQTITDARVGANGGRGERKQDLMLVPLVVMVQTG